MGIQENNKISLDGSYSDMWRRVDVPPEIVILIQVKEAAAI